MHISQRHPAIGTEVRGIRLSADLDEQTFADLHALWMRQPLLIFPGQSISDAEHVAFARRFGDIEIHPSRAHRSSAHAEIFRVSNVLETGELMPARSDEWKYMALTWIWHSDSSFREVPSMGSILHGIEVTSDGGETLFCNLYDVWAALTPARRRELAGLRVVHSHDQVLSHAEDLDADGGARYEALPPVEQPLVRVHPVSGRESLFLSPHTMSHVVGWSREASVALFEELTGFATQARFVYRHRWAADDVIAWDNRCTMHAVTPYASARDRRVMHRVTIAGDGPVLPAAAASAG